MPRLSRSVTDWMEVSPKQLKDLNDNIWPIQRHLCDKGIMTHSESLLIVEELGKDTSLNILEELEIIVQKQKLEADRQKQKLEAKRRRQAEQKEKRQREKELKKLEELKTKYESEGG